MKINKSGSFPRKTIAFLCFMSASLTMSAFAGQAKALDTLTLDTGNALGTHSGAPKLYGQPRATLYKNDVYDRNQQLSIIDKGNGIVMIKQVSTGKCLNAYRPGLSSPVNFWPCSDSDGDQKFRLELNSDGQGLIKRAGTDLCLDAPNRTAAGSQIQLHRCNANNPNHIWKRNPIINNPANGLPSTVTIVSRANNLALDAGGSNNNSIYGHNRPDTNNRWHQWDLRRAGNYYMVVNKATGKALDAGGDHGRDVYPHPRPNAQNDYHLWRIESVGGGNFMLVSKATGRALDSGGSNHDIYAYPYPIRNNSYHQWKLTGVSGSGSGSSSTQGQAFTRTEYIQRLYVSDRGSFGRGPHDHGGAIDSTAYGSTQVQALVGGEVIAVRNGAELRNVSVNRNWGYHPSLRRGVTASHYNGTVVIYNRDLNRTFTYLHFSSVNVRKGQMVNPGDVLGNEGSTGWSTGQHTHLHIQAGRNAGGAKENPLSVLGNARAQNILDKRYR